MLHCIKWWVPVSWYSFFFPMARQPLGGLGLPIFRGFVITLYFFRHTTLGRTPLDEWPARRKDLYLTKHNTHKRQTSMPPAGFEPTIPAIERPYMIFLHKLITSSIEQRRWPVSWYNRHEQYLNYIIRLSELFRIQNTTAHRSRNTTQQGREKFGGNFHPFLTGFCS
jgi:hypothetical protein